MKLCSTELFFVQQKAAYGILRSDWRSDVCSSELGKSEADAIKIVNSILSKLDIGKNGEINFSEFLMAVIDKEQLMINKNLEEAFKIFDRSGSGYIEIDDIKTVLGITHNYSDELWKAVIREVDQNKDGKISLSEFSDMMKNIRNSNIQMN